MPKKPVSQYGSDKQSPAQQQNAKPGADIVADFHTNADTDIRPESVHHTLGTTNSQAASGDHTHDGGDSQLLLTGFTLTGSRGGNAALPGMIACLVRLGATDSTSA